MTRTGDREIVVVSRRVGMYESVGPPRLEMWLIDNLIDHATSFPNQYNTDQTHFQVNIPSNRWYIARIFWPTPVEVVGELAGDFEPIRSGEIVWMNNNVFYPHYRLLILHAQFNAKKVIYIISNNCSLIRTVLEHLKVNLEVNLEVRSRDTNARLLTVIYGFSSCRMLLLRSHFTRHQWCKPL